MHACMCTHTQAHARIWGRAIEDPDVDFWMPHALTHKQQICIQTHTPQKYHYFTNNKLKWNIQSYIISTGNIILPISDVNIAPVQEAIIC